MFLEKGCVLLDDALGLSPGTHLAEIDPETLVAHALDGAKGMGNDNDAAAAIHHSFDSSLALSPESAVAHAENFVEDEDVRLD